MNIRLKNLISPENCYTLLYMVVICHDCLFDYFRAAIYKLPIVSGLSILFFPLTFVFLIIKSGLGNRIFSVSRKSFFIIVFFALAVFLSCVIYPENAKHILNADNNGNVRIFTHILPCILYYYLGEHFEPSEKIMKRISICCCISIAVTFLYLSYFLKTRTLLGDDMSASYSLLLSTMVVLNQALKERKLIYYLFSFFGFVHALMMGTRGPIVIIVCFCFIGIIYYSSNKTHKRIFWLIVFGALVILFFSSSLFKNLLHLINTWLKNTGFTTRIIDYILSDTGMFVSKGRDTIYDTLLCKLWDRPILGYGVYGEWQFTGYSAHNIYLEALFQYGIIIGSCIILSMFIGYLKALRNNANTVAIQWLLIMGCYVFVRGFFGGEILHWSTAFLLGFVVNQNSIRRNG